MNQDQPSRLDQIEATLERLSQQLDNQVVVNAELRQSTNELRQAITQLTRTAEALLQMATQHQENSMVLVSELRYVRQDMREMQSEICGLQSENHQILQLLEQQDQD